MHGARGERCTEVRKRRAVAHADEFSLHSRDAQATISEPARVEFPRRLDSRAIVALDFLQGFEDVRVGAESGENFYQRTEPAARRVKDSVEPLRIIPAVPEGPVAADVRPVRPGPRVGDTRDSVEGAIGRDCVKVGTVGRRCSQPPLTKVRAAERICGPTSSSSPSRSRRAAERSSSCGFKPWNQARATEALSC